MTFVVSQQTPFGGIYQHHAVAPLVLYDSAAPDLDVEWRDDDLAAGHLDARRRSICRVDLEVGLWTLALHLQNDLGVCTRHAETDRLVRAPEELVAEVVTVELKTSIEVWHVKPDAIDFVYERIAH